MLGPLVRPVLLLLVLTVGCGTTTVRRKYGHLAHFSAAHRGYVLTGKQSAPEVVLLDPVTGRKLQCREQVIGWANAIAKTLPEEAHDENLFRFTVAPFLEALVMGVSPLGVVLLPYAAGRSVSWTKLRKSGRAAMASGRAADAVALFERALLKGGDKARRHTTLLYELAAGYEALGHSRRARVTYFTFVTEAVVKETRAYDDALRQLHLLGHDFDECVSRESVALEWGRGVAKPRRWKGI